MEWWNYRRRSNLLLCRFTQALVLKCFSDHSLLASARLVTDVIAGRENSLTLDCGVKNFSGCFLAYIGINERRNQPLACVSMSFDGLWYEFVRDEEHAGDLYALYFHEFTEMVLLVKVNWADKTLISLKDENGQINGALVGWNRGDINATVDWDSRLMSVQGSYFRYDEQIDPDEVVRKRNEEESYTWLMVVACILAFSITSSVLLYCRYRSQKTLGRRLNEEYKRDEKLDTVKRYLRTRQMEWFYIDKYGREQGPISEMQMRAWFENGFLMPHTHVRLTNMDTFYPIHQMFTRLGGAFQEAANIDFDYYDALAAADNKSSGEKPHHRHSFRGSGRGDCSMRKISGAISVGRISGRAMDSDGYSDEEDSLVTGSRTVAI